MSCSGCAKRLKNGIIIPMGYKLLPEPSGDGREQWRGPKGQILYGDDIEERTTRTALKLIWEFVRSKLNGR